MGSHAVDLDAWLAGPLGSILLEQERSIVATALECAFGLHCLQVGRWGDCDAFLAQARTRRAALVAGRPAPGAALVAEPAALALQSDSVDVMLLPHTLEFAPEPHEVLREAARVLTGEGELVVLGFEPLGTWSLRNAFTRGGCPPGILRTIPATRTCGLAEAGRLRSGLADALPLRPAAREPGCGAGAQLPRARRHPCLAALFRCVPPARAQARPLRDAGAPAQATAHRRHRRPRRARGAARVLSRVEIFTDGACRGNPGAGGWGAVLRYRGRERELFGGEPDTTNNRMELTAAIRALEALQRRCRVSVYTDSQYVRDGITTWLADWKRRDWRTADRKPVKNQDLWQRLDALAAAHDVEWHWVRGHAGHPENERADALANRGIDELGRGHGNP